VGDEAINEDDPPLVECLRCGSTCFQIWAKWGIWYALCISCWDEYILAPKGVFALFRAPLDEVF